MAKVVCVLYDDPIGGYPKSYARAGIPKIERYPDGQTTPTPKKLTSRQASFWVACPVSSVCVSFLSSKATP